MDNLARPLDGEGDRLLRRSPSDDEFYEEFRGYICGVMGRSPTTAKNYISAAKRASRRLDKSVLKVHSDDLIDLIQHGGWAPATNRSMIVAFHSLDEFAKMRGYGGRNGIAHLKTPKVVHNKKPPIATRDAYRLLMAAETPIQVRTIYLGFYAGCRIAESSAMDESNWLEDTLVFIGKGGKKRTVPIHPELAKVKDKILSRKPSSKTSAGVIFGRLVRRLGILDTEGNIPTPHSMRRTLSTELYKVGAMWEIVQTVLGHELGVTGESYVQIGPEVIDGFMRKVEYRSGEPVQLSLDI